MKDAASPNQAEGSGPDSSAEQASSLVPENNLNLPAQGSSGEPTQPAINASNTSLALPQENTSLALLQAYTSILAVDVVNGIVKGGRSISPIREHTSRLDFFNIKEQRYLQHMQKFRNGDGSYTVSHPIAMSLFVALEMEQCNKHFIYAQNEYRMTHLRNIMGSANALCREYTR